MLYILSTRTLPKFVIPQFFVFILLKMHLRLHLLAALFSASTLAAPYATAITVTSIASTAVVTVYSTAEQTSRTLDTASPPPPEVLQQWSLARFSFKVS